MHTSYTDGEYDPLEVLKEAKKKKIEVIGFTEHVNRSSTWFNNFKKEILKLKKTFPKVKCLLGIEAKILDLHGNIDATPQMIKSSELILGVVHRWPLKTTTNLKKNYTCLLLSMIKKGQINVLGHPTYLFGEQIELDEEQIKKIATAAFEYNVAIEITSTKRVPSEDFVKICYQKGTKFSIGSDAHKKEDIGEINWSIDLLEKIGIDDKNIIKLI